MFVFVYGSLKKDFKYSYLLEDINFLGKAKTNKKFTMYRYKNSDFPFLNKEENFNIIGELYEIDKKTLNELDRLEGFPAFYSRELIDITCNGIKYSAYTYFLKEKIKNKTLGEKLSEWLPIHENSQKEVLF